MSDLLPKLKRIKVDPRKHLYLDPNNPRFIAHETDRLPEERFLDDDVIKKTAKKMRGKEDEYNIQIICDSIRKNGWQPVDFIFVRKFAESPDRYVVLEGNRRIVAVKDLLEDGSLGDRQKSELEEIEVMEVIDKIDKRRPVKSERELRKKISYLLGVRHHGSLKKWSPFAQAANIYQKYCTTGTFTDSTFEWKEETGRDIAQTLSMKPKDVKERIQVYRAMKQVGEAPKVKESENGEGDDKGGMKDRYYSVCREVLLARSEALKAFISQDDLDFLLDEQSLERIISLCHFDKNARKGSPINNPQQWRFLGKILGDGDEEKRSVNLERVQVGKESPEDVWAEREAELQRPEWGRWLGEVTRVFQGLTLADLEVNEESHAVMLRLTNLLTTLGGK